MQKNRLLRTQSRASLLGQEQHSAEARILVAWLPFALFIPCHSLERLFFLFFCFLGFFFDFFDFFILTDRNHWEITRHFKNCQESKKNQKPFIKLHVAQCSTKTVKIHCLGSSWGKGESFCCTYNKKGKLSMMKNSCQIITDNLKLIEICFVPMFSHNTQLKKQGK